MDVQIAQLTRRVEQTSNGFTDIRRADASEYLCKSIGNALRDISRKTPER